VPSDNVSYISKYRENSLSNQKRQAKCLRFCSGLDLIAIQTRQINQIASCRELLITFNQLLGTSYKRGFKTKNIPFAKNIKLIKKIITKTGLIEVYPNLKSPKYIQFLNEEKFIKSVFNFKTPMGERYRKLSISQKIIAYSASKNYSINFESEHAPLFKKDFKEFSWSLMPLLFTKNIGQAKMGVFLGRSRETVNQNLKHKCSNYLIIKNQFVKVGHRLHSSKYNKSSLQSAFKRHNLNGYKVDVDGNLYRQLANHYQINNKESFLELDNRNVFYYQNKQLNKMYSKKLESLSLANNSNVIKKIATLRSARRCKLKSILDSRKNGNLSNRKSFGASKNTFISAEQVTNKIWKGERFNFIYKKLQNELHTLDKLDIDLSVNFKLSKQVPSGIMSLGKDLVETKINLSRTNRIDIDKSFKELTNNKFQRFLGDIHKKKTDYEIENDRSNFKLDNIKRYQYLMYNELVSERAFMC